MTTRIELFCYSFVVGVIVATMFASARFTGLTLWLGLTGIAFFGAAMFFRKLILLFLGLSAAFLGSANFYRVTDTSSPSHISNYYSPTFFDTAIIRGTIAKDTDVRERFTNIDIEPEEIIRNYGDKKEPIRLQGRTGLMRIKVYPSIGPRYESLAYGDKVEIPSPILPPRNFTNPAGFDYGKYLKGCNIWAVGRPIRSPEEIKYLGSGRTNWLFNFAIKLKTKLLISIKRTIPYPESAFLGGIVLGIKSGVPANMVYQFQATGVAHVLSVSGLHVGFVHILLLAVCTGFRIPKKISYFVIVFGLVVFTILTGNSPPTIRSTLMAAIGQFLYTFGGLGVRGSGALTIPVSAFIMLAADPLVCTQTGFILSYTAIWSLVTLTDPVNDVFVRNSFTRGFIFFPAFFLLLVFTVISLISIATEVLFLREIIPIFRSEHLLMKNLLPDWKITTAVLYIMGVILFKWFQIRKNRDLIYDIYYGRFAFLKGIAVMTVAQLAIQIGMMIPLSGYYFYRFPIAGVYANFSAIPVSGLITQITLIAGVFDIFFSSVGLPFLGHVTAFVLSAGNWPLCQMFLGIVKSWAGYIPYGYTSSFSPNNLFIYYIGVLVFAFWPFFYRWSKKIYAFVIARRWLAYGQLALFFGGCCWFMVNYLRAEKKMEMIFFDSGFGNSVLLQSPLGKTFLIDGGRKDAFDFGDSTIIPTLSKKKVACIDAVIVTAPLEGALGGLLGILDKYPTKAVYGSMDPDIFNRQMSYREFLEKLGGGSYAHASRKPQISYQAYYDFLRVLDKHKREFVRPVAGQLLYQETYKGKKFKIEVLSPEPQWMPNIEDPLRNQSIVLKITYGGTSMLLGPQLSRAGEWALIDKWGDKLKSDILLAASNGNPNSSTVEFLKAVDPKEAIVQYGFVSKWARDDDFFYAQSLAETLRRFEKRRVRWYRTDTMGAVMVSSDGNTHEMKTMLEEDRTIAPSALQKEPASPPGEAIMVAL